VHTVPAELERLDLEDEGRKKWKGGIDRWEFNISRGWVACVREEESGPDWSPGG
jgi:hypothetical protein